MYCREIRFWKGIMDDDTRSRYLVGVKKYSNLVMENSRGSGKGVKNTFLKTTWNCEVGKGLIPCFSFLPAKNVLCRQLK